MGSRIAKFAPIGVVAGTMGYLCWPYVDDPALPPAPKAKTATELTAAMLSPQAAPPLSRDPFGSPPPHEKPSIARKTSKKHRDSPSPSANPAVAAGVAPDSVIPAPSSLVLHGTYVRGGHHVAIINQAVYAEGEQIAPPDAAITQCRVTHVGVDKVMLDLNGQIAELSYPEFKQPGPAVGVDPLLNAKRPLTSLVGGNDAPQATK
jgi:hypothetical protein